MPYKHLRPTNTLNIKTKRETPFDQGYDAGLMWGNNIDPDKQLITKVSRGTKSQYLAGLKLGQQEARKRKLQQLVLMDLS